MTKLGRDEEESFGDATRITRCFHPPLFLYRSKVNNEILIFGFWGIFGGFLVGR